MKFVQPSCEIPEPRTAFLHATLLLLKRRVSQPAIASSAAGGKAEVEFGLELQSPQPLPYYDIRLS